MVFCWVRSLRKASLQPRVINMVACMVNCIQGATGHTQEALKLLEDVHKMLGPTHTEAVGVQRGPIRSLSDLQTQLGKETRA
jgi:hypothetical protein